MKAHAHALELHRFLSRRLGDLADDLLGERFAAAFEGRASYRAELADSRPWLYGIAANPVRVNGDAHPESGSRTSARSARTACRRRHMNAETVYVETWPPLPCAA